MSNTTNHTGPHPTRIDEAIDRAVRELMHRDGPAGLRRRVLARLEAPAPRARLVSSGFVLAAAATLVFVAGATLMLRQGRQPDAPRTAIAGAPASSPQQPAAPARATAAPDAPVARRTAPPSNLARTETPRAAAQAPRPLGPAQGRVAATNVLDERLASPLPRAAAAATPSAELPPQAGLPALAEIQIAPIRIEAIPVPPITIK